MTLTLELPRELEEVLATDAARLGLPLAEYALRLIERASRENAPMTGAELVGYWQRGGLVGTRPDIADSAAYAREIRAEAEERVRA
jgi:hypothetical protein